jgi:hypothetical protein
MMKKLILTCEEIQQFCLVLVNWLSQITCVAVACERRMLRVTSSDVDVSNLAASWLAADPIVI